MANRSTTNRRRRDMWTMATITQSFRSTSRPVVTAGRLVDRNDWVIVAIVHISRRRRLVVDRFAIVDAIKADGPCRIPHPPIARQRRIGAERARQNRHVVYPLG